jgi:hypothetical protein
MFFNSLLTNFAALEVGQHLYWQIGNIRLHGQVFLTSWILLGNLGRDPEIRAMQSGAKMASFSIATSKRWKDRNTQEQKEKRSKLAKACFDFIQYRTDLDINGWSEQDIFKH